eukprot:scaffold42343_cov75-Phaeocystis_antarctica.AAC.5
MVHVDERVLEVDATHHPIEHLLDGAVRCTEQRLFEHNLEPFERQLAARCLAERVRLREEECERVRLRRGRLELAHESGDQGSHASHRAAAVDAECVAIDEHDKAQLGAALSDHLERDRRRDVDLHARRILVPVIAATHRSARQYGGASCWRGSAAEGRAAVRVRAAPRGVKVHN